MPRHLLLHRPLIPWRQSSQPMPKFAARFLGHQIGHQIGAAN